jgi:hypothetical protein
MNKLRRSYEARVLLVPLGQSAGRLSSAMAQAGLDGIQTLMSSDSARYEVRPLGGQGWGDIAGAVHSVQDVVGAADMVVLLAANLAEVSPATCDEVAKAANDNGVLIAALIVGEQWDTPSDNTAMATLREAVDMLVVVRSLLLATPFIDVLRGGPRSAPTPATA